MKKKNLLFIVLGVLLLAAAINYWSGTTMVINGRHITGMGKYIATYVALIVWAVVLVVLIPSVFIMAVVLVFVFVVVALLFFPLMPIAFILLPGIIFVGVVWLVYRLVKKK